MVLIRLKISLVISLCFDLERLQSRSSNLNQVIRSVLMFPFHIHISNLLCMHAVFAGLRLVVSRCVSFIFYKET